MATRVGTTAHDISGFRAASTQWVSWEPPPANIPTNLRTSNVTTTTARYKWDAPT